MGELRTDLVTVLRAWRRQPSLPLLVVSSRVLYGLALLAVTRAPVPLLSRLLVLVAIPFLLLSAGLSGAEREWYRTVFDGGRFGLRDLVAAIYRYAGRFVALGLLFGVPLLAFDWWLLQVAVSAQPFRPGSVAGAVRTARLLGTVPLVIVDFLLTFVSPALVFSTRHVIDAILDGILMIRRLWPKTLPYVLFPPLALQAIGLTSTSAFGPLSWIEVVVTSLLLLWAVGATSLFYLRHAPEVLEARGGPRPVDVLASSGGPQHE